MAVVTKTVVQEVTEVADILCDKCGRSCRGKYNFCGITFEVSGGYDSPVFPDDESVTKYHICEHCAQAWIDTFAHTNE